MFFTKAFILNDTWVYARFEDGHIQGYGIFEYTVEKDMGSHGKLLMLFLMDLKIKLKCIDKFRNLLS